MKKKSILLIILMWLSLGSVMAQTKNIATISVANDTTHFGVNLPAGQQVYDFSTLKLYILKQPALSSQSISTSSVKLVTLNDSIAANKTAINANASNISTNASNINTNASNVSTNTTKISTNATHISTNTANINTNTNTNTVQGDTLTAHNTRILANKADIQSNATAIATKESAITAGATTQYWRGDKTWQTLLGNTSTTAFRGDYGQAAYNGRISSFTTTGNSGAATFSGNTLNIPNYTLSGLGFSSGDYIQNQNSSAQSASLWISGTAKASKFIIPGGTSAQYLLADGSTTTVSGSVYKGELDGSTGIPVGESTALADGSGTVGWYYACSVAGGYDYGSGSISLDKGDQLYYNGSAWIKVPGAGSYTLPIATNTSLGGIKVGTGLSINGGVLSINESDPLFGASVASAITAIDTTHWGIAYNKRISSFTTNGSSGSATFNGNILNIPNYTLSGLGGQPQLNGTGFVKANGTTISYDNNSYSTTTALTDTASAIRAAVTTNTANINTNADSITALRNDVNNTTLSKVERFTAIQGQTKFGLSSQLSLSNLIFLNGNLIDDSQYTGVGTDTLTFNTPLSLYDHVTAFYSYGSANNTYWYGVEWDTTVSDPNLTRIGNVEYQATLPVQSRMVRAVVNDDGTINYYLDPNNSNKKADGTVADLTGASGQVMVIVPTHWERFEKTGTKRRIMIATVALPGFTKVPEYAVGAYEAYYNSSTGKLESRSGVMPTTSLTRANYRTYAAARGPGWHQLDYNSYKDIFYLYLTEYATFDIQSVIPGATNASSSDWSAYNGYNPVVANGVSNSYGNYSASVPFSLTNFVGGTGTLDSHVADYRGIENVYGHIWQFIDGINVNYVNDSVAYAYVNANPSTFTDDTQNGYTTLGKVPNSSGWIRSLIDDSWIPATDVGASSSTYMTDYHYVSSTQTGVWRVVLAGGSFSNGSSAGLLFSHFHYSSSGAYSFIGGRLCLKIQ